MAVVESAPTAVHIGDDELPFVEIGNGNKMKVLQVKEREGLWIVENIFQGGFAVQTHRHTGPVWGYTTAGAWKYKEYDYVNRGGLVPLRTGRVRAHAARASKTTRACGSTCTAPTSTSTTTATSTPSPTARARSPRTTRCARRRGCPRPNVARRLMIELWDPDAFVEAPPHEFLAELRRTQPVYWQDMPDEPGFWAVLKHADLTAVAREPVLFSASEGGVVMENLDEVGLVRHAQHAAGDGPAAPHRVPAPARAELQGEGHRRDGRTDPRHLPRRSWNAARRAGRRRVRPRGRRAPAHAGDRRARRSPPRGLAADPGVGGAQHERAGHRDHRSDADAEYGDSNVNMAMYAIELAARRRAEPPREDLLSLIIAGNFGDGPMTDIEFGSFFVQLITAANDTTKSMLSRWAARC